MWRDCGVDFNLLAGRVDRIRDLPCGQLTVALAGGDIDQALRQTFTCGYLEEVGRVPDLAALLRQRLSAIVSGVILPGQQGGYSSDIDDALS